MSTVFEMHMITVRHNFESAHRLPHLRGKCASIHGHSWWAEVTVAAPQLGPAYTVAEFGQFKSRMRSWIDAHLDHGAMLGAADPLIPAFEADGSKLFVFGRNWDGAPWPTVEAVACLLADQARTWLHHDSDQAAGARVTRVRVTETVTNAAEWAAEAPLVREVTQPRLVPGQAELEFKANAWSAR